MFEEIFNRVSQNVDYNEVADKVDEFANKVEAITSHVIDFLAEADSVVDDYVSQLRTNAENLRAQAGPVAEKPVTKEEVREVTREQKIEFVRGRLDNVGIKDSRWANPEYADSLTDEMVDNAYKAWGGK